MPFAGKAAIHADFVGCGQTRSRRRLLVCGLGAVAIAFGVTLGGGSADAQSPTTFKFAASPTWYGQVPVMVAIDKGYFKKEGLDVKFTPILSSGDRLAALTAGSVDFSNLGRVAAISDMARGNKAFYFVANIDDSPGNEGCWGRPGIKTIADMRGKKVAANTSAEITMTLLLKNEGMTQKDIKLVNLSPTEMAPALARGDVDVACVWQPLLNGLKKAVPNGHLLGTDKDTEFYKKFGTMASPDVVVMSRNLVDKHPKVAAKLIEAVFRGADFSQKNPKKAAEIVAHYFKKPASDLVAPIKKFHYFGEKGWPKHISLHTQQMQALADMLYRLGKIGSDPDVKKWENTSFIPKP